MLIVLTYRPQASSAMFFEYNTQLGPPFHIIVDTNFVNFSIKNKLDVFQSMMDCLYAKCKPQNKIIIIQKFVLKANQIGNFVFEIPGTPYITDCVMAELEKLGSKYRIALKIVRDPRFERLPCDHKGTYADDCIVQRVTQV